MANKSISFSVLMSVYYKEKVQNLKLALDSILEQTLMPNQVVLVEDGKLTKELDELIDEYEKKYEIIDVIKLKKNVGLGNALNEGLKYCKYEYVARMDSDDVSVYDRFEVQVKYIAKNRKIDVVGGNILEFDDVTGKDISIREVPLTSNNILDYLKKRNPMNHVTVMFKKESVESVGGYKDCPYFEDYYLWARLLKNNYVLENIPNILVKVRAGLSMSNRRGNLSYIKCIINFEKKLLNLDLIKKHTFFLNIILRSLVSLIPNKLRYFIYQKKLRKSYD